MPLKDKLAKKIYNTRFERSTLKKKSGIYQFLYVKQK